MAPPDTTDGRSAGQQPVQADVAALAEPAAAGDVRGEVTRQRALAAAFVPVTRTLQRIRPAGRRLGQAAWLRPVREVPWLRPVREVPWL
ncbi:MAG: hypothetical protein WBH47_04065, partial [Streptosporangiaceae bacterium]